MLISAYFVFEAINLLRVASEMEALAIPVSLSSGTITTPTFRVGIDYWDYQIDVRFDPKFDRVPEIQSFLTAPHRQRFSPIGPATQGAMCLLGAWQKPEQCEGIQSVIDISWELREGLQTIAEGSLHRFDNGAEIFGGEIFRTIGKFRGQRGRQYQLILHVNQDASALNVTQPRLIVHIPYDLNEDVAMPEGFSVLFAFVSGVIGLILVYPAARRWRTRRSSAN